MSQDQIGCSTTRYVEYLPLQVGEVVGAVHSQGCKLRKSERTRLRLVVRERVGVPQPGQIAQDLRARIDVRVSHATRKRRSAP